MRSQRPLALTKPPFHRSHGLGSGSVPGKELAGTQPGVLKRNAPQHTGEEGAEYGSLIVHLQETPCPFPPQWPRGA